MNLKIAVTSFLVIFSLSNTILSDEIDRAFITYKGTEGYFFKESIGDKLLGDVKKYELELKKMEEFKLNLKDKDYVIKRLEQNVEVFKTISKKWEEAFVGAMDQVYSTQDALSECSNTKEAWYKHPTVWFFVGFATSSATAIGLAFGLDKI